MKKWVIGIILSLSVSFMIGILNVNAEEHDFSKWIDIEEFTMPNNSVNLDNYYIVIWQRPSNTGYRMVYWPKSSTNITGWVLENPSTNVFPYADYLNFFKNNSWASLSYYDTSSLVNKRFNSSPGGSGGTFGTSFVVYSNYDIKYGSVTHPTNDYFFNTEWLNVPFEITFEQGEVLMSNYNNLSANLVSYYLEPTFDDFNPEDYKFCYISTGGGFRDNPTCFELTYIEAGINYNNNIYHYYYNLPLFYNINLGFIIYDNEDNIIQQDNINAYLSVLSSLEGYTIYDFTNYEYANMSNINSGLFALSPDLADNVDIYVVDISSGNKTNFFTSTYYIDNDSYYDSVGNRWISFNFNNASVYLEIINKVNDITDFWSYADNYHLYMYFPNSAYIHLSGSPNIEDNQDNPVNQQSYMDSNGDIHYVDNPIKSDFSDTSGFMSHFNSYFGQYTDSTGLTSIIIAPLNLISSLSSSTCEPLNVPLPYVNSNLTLPCMTQVYKFYFPLFYDMYEIVTYGLVSYHILVYMLYIIKKAKDPKNDEIEVMDL